MSTSYLIWGRVLVLFFLSRLSNGTQVFDNAIYLDNEMKYQLSWSVDETQQIIQFKVIANTTGWVGFGIAKHSINQMKGDDIIMAYITNDETTFFKDMSMGSDGQPTVDDEQDYKLQTIQESNGQTVVEFMRQIRLCDEKQDLPFMFGGTTLIYGYGDSSSDETALDYKQGKTGTKRVFLFDPPSRPDNQSGEKMNFHSKNAVIPPKEMSYWCTYFVTSGEKKSAVAVNPEITKGNENHVIQIELFKCDDSPGENTTVMNSTECPNPTAKTYMADCLESRVVFIWGRGGGNFVFPDGVGLPFGDGENEHYILRVLYYNADKIVGIVDNSGLQFTLVSPALMQDAGILPTGRLPDGNLLIPPGQANWTDHGYCLNSPDCPLFGESLTIIAAFPKQSTGAKSIRTSIIDVTTKAETAILTIDEDYNYLYPAMRNVRPAQYSLNDSIVTTCDFNTENIQNVIKSGNNPEDPACITYLLYYPKTDAYLCSSTNEGVETFVEREATKLCVEGNECTYDWSGRTWDTSLLSKLKETMDSIILWAECHDYNETTKVNNLPGRMKMRPQIEKTLIPMNLTKSCENENTGSSSIMALESNSILLTLILGISTLAVTSL